MKKLWRILVCLSMVLTCSMMISTVSAQSLAADTITTGSGRSQYYDFSVTENSRVYFTLTNGSLYLNNDFRKSIDASHTTVTKNFKLTPGDYTAVVSGDDYGEFQFSYSIKPYNWGRVEVNGLENVNTKKETSFDIRLLDADPDVKLFSWSLNRENSGDLSGTSGSGTISKLDPGLYDMRISLDDPDFNYESKNYKITVRPEAIRKVTLSDLNVSNSSVTFNRLGDTTLNGDKTVIQQLKGKSWVDVKTVDSYTNKADVTGLKADTSYKFRLIGKMSEGDVRSLPGRVLSFKTGLRKAPAIKSVKASNVKETYVKKSYHSGYWTPSGRWISGYNTGGYYVTTYTLKVTLKRKMKNQAGLMINLEKVPGKGKTFKKKMSVHGRMKGKKDNVMIHSYRSNKYKGSSKVVWKKVKL